MPFFLNYIIDLLDLLGVVFANRLLMVTQDCYLTVAVIVNFDFRVLSVLGTFLAQQFFLECVARVVRAEDLS